MSQKTSIIPEIVCSFLKDLKQAVREEQDRRDYEYFVLNLPQPLKRAESTLVSRAEGSQDQTLAAGEMQSLYSATRKNAEDSP